MNPTRDRIDGRKHAEELLGLADLGGKSEAYIAGFWRSIGNLSAEHNETPVEKPTVSKMTDEAAAIFERIPIGYGQHQGKPYGEVPIDYLLWIHESNEALARYLRSERGQRRQGE